VLIPWWHYIHFGDKRILEDSYPALQRYMAFLERCGTNRVEPIGSMQGHTQVLWTKSEDERFPSDADRGHLQVSQWGDHLATADGHRARANMPLSIATAFYYLDATTMAKTARALGLEEDAARYSDLASRINAAFHERFFDPVMGYYDAGTQSAQAWPLAFGMVSDDQRENIERALIGDISSRQRRLTTGYASTRFAIEALAQADRHDVIWELATKTDFPSWGYMLSHGRTTSCERWDGEGGSLNHAPLGAAIDEWFYNGLAGIQPDPAAPGYANIIFKPYLPADLDWAQASINTTRGPIKSSWRKHGHHATLDIEVPANSTATVHLPAGDPSKITEQDTPVAQSDDVTVVDSTDDVTTLTVGSGCYRFTFPRTCSAT
jgi:alpha-L-rhamnosidase